jgi:stearoyl-CoA desaturase (delta-9 desaturase)
MTTPNPGLDEASDDHHEDILYPEAVPFVLLHLASFAAIWTGVTWQALVICVVLYFLRIFAIGAGYHRYFAHRAYSTSRVFQFFLAFLSQSTAQKSALWWAAKHRHHHLHSDTELDVHSPRHRGFVYAHLGWIFSTRHRTTDLGKIADFARFPELMLLHKWELTPAVILAVITFLIGGWSGLVVGFVWSTVLVYHGTFCINSLAHVHGRKRYVTGDDSRNNWLLALMTMGEGWHNNHHAFQSSVRQGFRWWEIDPTFYILKSLSWCGVVWNLKTPPEAVLRNEQRLGTKIIERAAAELAGSFHIDRIAAAMREALVHAHAPTLSDLQDALAAAQHKTVDLLAKAHFPALPTREEFRLRAAAMFAKTRSMEDIVERAHRMVLDAVSKRLAAA